ncbi:MAG TPA: hypothetical protein VEU33_52570 [Archangium sp.]|nr:hypothetical protein [Archangium sp.]
MAHLLLYEVPLWDATVLLGTRLGSASGAGDASTPTGQANAFDIRYVRAWKFK